MPRRAGHCATTCSAPPRRAPKAIAYARSIPAAVRRAGRAKAATRNATFKSPGANAATPNFRFAFSAAIPSAAVPMKKMYGKTMRVIATVRSNSSGRPRYPLANRSARPRASSTPRMVTTTKAKSDTPRARAKKLVAAGSPSSASFLDKTGTRALETAPSPRSCRRALGIVNATKKASVSSRVKIAASAMSRPSPKMRDRSVPAPTTDARRTSLLRSPCPRARADSVRLGAGDFRVLPQRHGRAALGALTDRAEVLVRVQPRPVPVEPLDAEGIVADDLEVLDLELDPRALEEADGPRVALAPRARAVAAQDIVRVDALVAIPPVDLGRRGSAR